MNGEIKRKRIAKNQDDKIMRGNWITRAKWELGWRQMRFATFWKLKYVFVSDPKNELSVEFSIWKIFNVTHTQKKGNYY